MHAVPLPMTGNYMPPKSDFRIDESNFTYGPKQSKTSESDAKTSESDAKTSDFDYCKTNSRCRRNIEICAEPYESDGDDEYVIKPSKEQEKPSFAFVNTVKHVKTPRETVKEQNTCSPSPKVNKRDWNGSMSKRLGLGYGFTKKACFVCGSFSHLIRDCDFHEKRMAKLVKLNKKKGKGTGQGENRHVWNNMQRLNHQNKFVPKAVLTKTGIFSVNTARQNPFSQAAETSTARKVNTARQNPFSQAAKTSIARKVNTARSIVNEIRLRNNFYKSHLPIRRPFNKSTAPKVKFTNNKVNTVGDKTISAIRETAVEASANLIQICLISKGALLQPHTRTYPTPVLTRKVFSNMKRVTRGYSGEDIPLFPSMITAPKTSPLRITSSPSLSPQHIPVSAPSTSPPPITETTPTAEEPAPMPHESPLQSVK
ncbi:hypothetical protein Tco_0923555 [Tanacetum coccineum]|uniref:Uncharacterized protein n=1 Tax=Tanacetum coccineum TaxID=301880 RepID=A0ABQ5D4L4_9ASTR